MRADFYRCVLVTVFISMVALGGQAQSTNLVWSGSSGSNWDNTTTSWLNAGLPSLFYNGANVTFDDTGNASQIAIIGTVIPGRVTVGSTNINYTFSGAGSITGPATLLKVGASTLMISSSNSYTGGTIIGGGTLRLGTNNALGVSFAGNPLVIISNNASLDLNGITPNSTNAVVIQGTNATPNQGLIYSSSGWSYLGGTEMGVNNLTLAGDAAIGGAGNWFSIGNDGNSGINGQNHNLIKIGSGVVALKGPASSSLASFTVAAGGVYFYGAKNWLGTGATLILSNNSYIDSWDPYSWSGITVPNNIIISAGGGSIYNDRSPYYGQANQDVYNGNLTLNAPLVLHCTSTFTGYPNPTIPTYSKQTFNGAISGTFGITATIVSGGTVNLTGAEIYTGPTVVVGGSSHGGQLMLSTIQQGGGTYTINDGGGLDVPFLPPIKRVV